MLNDAPDENWIESVTEFKFKVENKNKSNLFNVIESISLI